MPREASNIRNRPPETGPAGVVLHLPEALRRYPKHKIVVYGRVSSWAQAGRGKEKLGAKTRPVVRDILALAPNGLTHMVLAVESGKLSKPRPYLLKACDVARKRKAMVVTSDLSRFLRAESYCRRTNCDVMPTAQEFARLRQLTGDVILATVADPAMRERERHSLATRRSGKCGRPWSIDHHLAIEILERLDWLNDGFGRRPPGTWTESMAGVAKWLAKKIGKSESAAKSVIQRLVNQPVPVAPADSPGERWKDLLYPATAYKKAYERGLLR